MLRKFKGLYQYCCSRLSVDEVEMRLTIKLFIYSFRRETNAFKEYTNLCQSCCMQQSVNPQLRVLHSLLLQDLKVLLGILEPKLSSEDDSVVTILRQAAAQN